MSKFITALPGEFARFLRRTIERVGPERHRKQLAERRAQAEALGPAQMDARLRARELGELLTAAAAGWTRLGAFRHDHDLDDLALAGGDHGADGGGLGALRDRIRSVLDVAARVETAAAGAHTGADPEAGVRRVRVGERVPREVQHGFEGLAAHRSFTYGTPIARGATARPTKPASSRTGRTEGIGWSSW